MPIYQKKKDKANEDIVFKKLEEVWNCTVHGLPHLHAFDAVIMDRKRALKAWVEVKTRTHAHNQYPTQWIDFFKWAKLADISDQSNKPIVFAYKFTDGIFYYLRNPNQPAGLITMGGRTDRNDPYDIKPVVNMDISSFERLRNTNQSN